MEKSRPPTIKEDDFPALYQAADLASLRGQQLFLRATKTRLSMLVTGALLGSLTWKVYDVHASGILAAFAFGIALASELYLLKVRPDRCWYDGRAAAESSKTLTWRFLVGGAPFARTAPEDEVEEHLLKRFEEIARDIRGVNLVPGAQAGDQITDPMRLVRALRLEERRDLYRTGRIEDQIAWYKAKAQTNSRLASRWSVALAAAEAIGLLGAILKATDVLQIGLLGFIGAAAAAGTAWVQSKQYQTLTNAYSVAAQELAAIHSRMHRNVSEEEWAHFVDQAEEAISREHTLWRASHT